jgi:hypothetical protein
MRAALYYPGWGVADPHFMFESLLYWDRLACIVPYGDFPPSAHWPPGFEREAQLLHERFVSGIEPSEEAKDSVHERLAELFNTEAPAWCRPERLNPGSAAVLSVRKVSARTINMLSERGWLAGEEDSLEVRIAEAAAGIVLGALAAEVGSNSMPTVTDDRAVFWASCNGLLRELQSANGIEQDWRGWLRGIGEDDRASDAEVAIVLRRIVKLGIEPTELTPAALGRLRGLREDSGFDEQRQRFCAQLERYLDDLRASPASEHGLLHDHWEQELRADRRALVRELRSAGLESISEREGVVALAAGAAVGIGATASGGPLGLVLGLGIAGAGSLRSIRKRRREVVEKHWTAWLAAASHR